MKLTNSGRFPANIQGLRLHVCLFNDHNTTGSLPICPSCCSLNSKSGMRGIIDHDSFKRGTGDKKLVGKIIDELDSLRDKVKAP